MSNAAVDKGAAIEVLVNGERQSFWVTDVTRIGFIEAGLIEVHRVRYLVIRGGGPWALAPGSVPAPVDRVENVPRE